MIWFLRRQQASVSKVGQGCQLEGVLHADGPLKVEGTVLGLVSANGDIEVAETGLVEGLEIRGHNIVVQGVVKAHVYAEGKLTLGATARIEGDVTAGMIDVDPGAYYTGYLATYDSRTPFYCGVDKAAAASSAADEVKASDAPVQGGRRLVSSATSAARAVSARAGAPVVLSTQKSG